MAERAVEPAQFTVGRMIESYVLRLPIRLLAIDIDGTLLNSQFQISALDMAALRHAHREGVEVVLADRTAPHVCAEYCAATGLRPLAD